MVRVCELKDIECRDDDCKNGCKLEAQQYDPQLKDVVKTSYTKITHIQGAIIEMRVLENGVHAYKVQHLDGFENWYMKNELTKIGKFSEKFRRKPN